MLLGLPALSGQIKLSEVNSRFARLLCTYVILAINVLIVQTIPLKTTLKYVQGYIYEQNHRVPARLH